MNTARQKKTDSNKSASLLSRKTLIALAVFAKTLSHLFRPHLVQAEVNSNEHVSLRTFTLGQKSSNYLRDPENVQQEDDGSTNPSL